MTISRRIFVQRFGGASVATLGGLTLAGRGAEAATGLLARGLPVEQPGAPGPASLIRLDSNENPLGPPPAVLDAIKASFVDAGRYPARAGNAIGEDLAALHRTSPENIVVACGSGEILRMSVDAFTSPTKSLVAGLPTFESCVWRAKQLGRPLTEVPVLEGGLGLDLASMAANAKDAGLIFLCNPNNPTGVVHGAAEVSDFIARVKRASPDTIILVDEAYHEYVMDPSYATAVPTALQDPQVIVSRTFSKVYGMAGVRLGYAIGHPDTIKKLAPWRMPNSVSILAHHAGRAALAARAMVPAERTRNREALDFTGKAFEDLGYKVVPSQANFVFVDLRRDARAFQAACRERGVAVGRQFPPLVNYTRVSIGTLEEMRRAAEVFRQVLSAAPSAAAR